MEKYIVIMTGIVMSLFLMSCSTLIPYEENFACRNRDNLGKCLDVENAYGEAVEGIHEYPHFDENANEKIGPDTGEHPGGSTDPDIRRPDSVTPAFQGYKEREYRELVSLIDQPVTPVVKPPKVIRTLIFPYVGKADDTDGYLYMPRYVYSILEEKRWVIGNYLRGIESGGIIDNLINPEENN